MRAAGSSRLLAVIGASALVAMGSFARAADPPSLGAVFDRHFCDLHERLTRIHRSTQAKRSSRYLIIEPQGRPDAYVQCRFGALDTRMQCEAASGHYPVHTGPPRPHPVDPAALAALGFRVRSGENDAQEIDLGQTPDLGRVAALMLRALHDGYGFRAPTPLVIKAPLAKEPDIQAPGCVPVS